MKWKDKRIIRSVEDLFNPSYRRETERGCWEWTGSHNVYGYATFKRGGNSELVHRVVLESIRGPLGDLNALHECDNRSCFRPEHLFPGTDKINMQDMCRKGRHWIGRSGVPGVIWNKVRQQWQVKRAHSGQYFYFGCFDELADAITVNAQIDAHALNSRLAKRLARRKLAD